MTKLLYYDDAYQKEFTATVLDCIPISDHFEIVLDQTAFYPEGGGQPSDVGYLDDCEIYDVHKKDDIVYHYSEKNIEIGKKVKGSIDFDRRFDLMQQHSGEHIVSGLICQKFNCNNIGFHLGDEVITIDYDADITMSGALEIEQQANEYISKNIPIHIFYPTKDELKDINFRSKKEIEGDIRLVEFKDADLCACCGTHVNKSSEVMLIKFLSAKKYKNGTRLELVCGLRAYKYLLENWQENISISKKLSAQYFETSSYVDNLIVTIGLQRVKINKLLEEKHEQLAEKYKGTKNLLLIEDDMDSLTLKKLLEKLAENVKGYICLFAGNENSYKYMIIDPENKIIANLNAMNAALNGKGGGKNGFAQGSINASKQDIENYFANL